MHLWYFCRTSLKPVQKRRKCSSFCCSLSHKQQSVFPSICSFLQFKFRVFSLALNISIDVSLLSNQFISLMLALNCLYIVSVILFFVSAHHTSESHRFTFSFICCWVICWRSWSPMFSSFIYFFSCFICGVLLLWKWSSKMAVNSSFVFASVMCLAKSFLVSLALVLDTPISVMFWERVLGGGPGGSKAHLSLEINMGLGLVLKIQ